MSDRLPRLGSLTLFAALAAVLAGGPAAGQGIDWKSVKLAYEPAVGNQLNRVADLQYGRVLVKGPDLKSNQEFLRKVAKALVFPVTQESYYVLPESGDLRARTSEQNFFAVLDDLDRRLVKPTPANNIAQMQLPQADYVTEFGAALDEALTAVYAVPNLPPVVRVNATRLLASAARSGAPVHGKMIQALLTDQYFQKNGKAVETPPEVLLHALKAAANLLAAYDLKTQNSFAATRHTLPEPELIKLVKTLEDLVVKGPPVADKAAAAPVDMFGAAAGLPDESAAPPPAAGGTPPAGKLDAKVMTEEQVRVVRYFRKEAVKALAQCRFDVIGGQGGSADARPGYTLARVAVNDAALSLPATPAEAVEAVVGLCNMNPSAALSLPAYATSVAAGVAVAVAPKQAAADDKSLPWKLVGARLGAATGGLKAKAQNTPRLRTALPLFTQLGDLVQDGVVRPLTAEAAGAANVPTLAALEAWAANTTAAEASKSLYTDDPKYTLTPRPAGR